MKALQNRIKALILPRVTSCDLQVIRSYRRRPVSSMIRRWIPVFTSTAEATHYTDHGANPM
jgi:hypothetical protein